MPALLELETNPVATGTTLSSWLRTEMESDTLTGSPLPARLVCIGREGLERIDVFKDFTGSQRSSFAAAEGSVADQVRNLSHLLSAARLIIPELRDLTPSEKTVLQRYYKGIYRKV